MHAASTLRYGFVGAGFVARFHLPALRQLRGIEVAGVHGADRRAESLAAGARRGAWATRSSTTASPRWRSTWTCIAVFAPNFARVAIVEAIVDAVKAGAAAEGRDLREAARPQRRRGPAPGRAGAVGEPAHRLLREPDLHEADPDASWRSSSRCRGRWGRSRWPARPRSTAGRTKAGSGIRPGRAAACCATWAATASRSAGTC